MINISISKSLTNYHIDINGHAGSGTAGNDIVCAGVSALAYTLRTQAMKINALDKFDESDGIKLDINRSWQSDEAVDTLSSGFQLMAITYPKNIKLKFS